MKFFKKGEKIQFKNSKKTIELNPTYCFNESHTGSVRDSWLRRLNLYKNIKDNQKFEDDLGIIEESNEYLKEQIKVGRDASIASLIVTIVMFIDFKYILFEKVSANSIAIYNILSASILSGFGALTIQGISETIKNICTKFKLKSIKKEVENNIEKQKVLEESNDPVVEKKIETKKSVEPSIKKDSQNQGLSRIDQSWFEFYKKYILLNGGDKKIFELPAITQIIEEIIQEEDLGLKYGLVSPLYQEKPKTDGTFDIYGMKSGSSAKVAYIMNYCHDENPEHFIILKKYDIKEHDGDRGIEFDGVGYQEIIINREGDVVHKSNEVIIDGFSKYDTLQSQLTKKKLLNK